MKNIIIGFIVFLFIGIGVYFLVGSLNKKSDMNIAASKEQNLVSPTRLADINGYVLSVIGNEITVANEIGIKEITDEEKARRQKLTQEERQALKVQESANLTKENVTLAIPVGVTIVKGTGDASGNNVRSDMSEIVKGIYLSIWKLGDSIEYVKLKGVSGQ